MPVCLCVGRCVHMSTNVSGGWKKTLDTPELEVQPSVGAGSPSWVLCRSSAHNHGHPSGFSNSISLGLKLICFGVLMTSLHILQYTLPFTVKNPD